jgi:molybdopterin-binding protein
VLTHPHDIQILPEPDGTGTEALVERVAQLSTDVRLELKLPDGQEISARVSSEDAEQLELAEGQIISVRLPAPRTLSA